MNDAGVTQVAGLQPRKTISIKGVDYTLKRDATDSATIFPHDKVHWLNAGCEPLGNTKTNYCWIFGVIPPTPGTLERPLNVMYVGFHPARIPITPNTVSRADLDRMHVYTSDASLFAQDFVNAFLGKDDVKPEEREHISPWPTDDEARTS